VKGDFVDALLREDGKAKGRPQGYSTETDGDTGVIETPGLRGDVADFDGILRECGFDPEVFELDGSPRISRWEAQTPDGAEWLTSYRIAVRRKADPADALDAEELVRAIHSGGPDLSLESEGSGVLVVALGDIQIGKASGDGTEGIVRRFRESIAGAMREIEDNPPSSILLAILGDCIEGVVSQKGRVIGSSDLGLTDQLRVLRHLLTHAIRELCRAGVMVHVAVVSGNHDEAFRDPVEASPNDSFAIDSVRAVEEAFVLAGWEGLTFHYPAESELSLAVTVEGHRFLLAHGHQWRKAGGHFDWWRKQAFSYQTGHDAEYLLAGHRHHFEVDTDSRRFYIQVPALESRSDWWRNQSGQVGNPGMVLLRPGDRQPSMIKVV
jgi:predicted phosphodiesterase